MSIQQQTTECTLCGLEMDLVDEGTETSIPIIGSDVEYRRYRCAECGQAVRYASSQSRITLAVDRPVVTIYS